MKEDIEIQAALYEDACHNPSVQQHFKDGAEWMWNTLEKNRLSHCENMTKEECERETKFVIDFIEWNKRTPTFSDCIEITRKQMIEKLNQILKLQVLYKTMPKDVAECIIDALNEE